jgi:anti-sigma B factor antagonist
MALHIGERELQDVRVLDLAGRLVAGPESTDFIDLVKRLVGSVGAKIILNLKSLTTIDSTGLGAMVVVRSAAVAAGGEIKLLNASQRHINLLVLTRLATLFPSFNDESEAVRSFVPPEQRGHQFDILEFVRSEEESGPLTGEDHAVKDGP